ncbi:esterase B1-like isoform X2 [Zophobas morio]
MVLAKINVMWKALAKNIYIIKILLLTVIRHYLPGHRKVINIYKRLKNVEGPVVSTTNGKLRGKVGTAFNDRLFYSFQGIPYAKPPLGALRFKAPQPPEPWTGIKDATHEGNDCVSRHTVLRTLIGSEDCLTLNVYTPELPTNQRNDDLKPVMFWIHGGGFTSGSGSTEAYGPEFILMEDVVLVTINYRTGILGFLCFEDPDLDIPGNAGMKDMLMALQWVHDNIIHFGGNPNNVTIFGESAGAAACHYLILSPKAKGLFHKAILQSGCAINVWAKGRSYTEELSEVLGLETRDDQSVFKAIQDLPPDQLYKAAEKMCDVSEPFIACKVRPHGPVVERKSKDAFLWENPLDIMKSGRYNHVPIIIGFTTREGILGEIVQKPYPFRPITNFELSVPHFLKIARGSELSKQLAEKIKLFYYGDEEPTTENKDKYYILETDNFFLREILTTVKYHEQNSSDSVYLYRMSSETSLNMLKKIYNMTEPGVCHGDDIGYLFKNLLTPNIEPGSDEDIGMRRFVHMWTNFAKYGNPVQDDNTSTVDVKWKPVTQSELHFLDIGKELTMELNPEPERMEFWSNLFDIY